MRNIAAVPAVGILGGAVFGLLVPDLPRDLASALLIACAALAWWAWWTARSRRLAAVIVAAFFVGGALLAADAWQRAWRPSLRVAFEERAREARAQAAAEGRRLPEDDEAFVVVEGVLRADAAATASGVSLSVNVDGLAGQVGRVGQIGQVGQVGRVGQVGYAGEVGEVGQIGRVGQVGHVGQVR